MKTNEIHPFGPVYDEHAKVLILGSFPSVKSREEMFFYAHPRNRFWKVMKAITGFEGDIGGISGKTKMLKDNHIALWDTIASCEITGSSDLSISSVVVNDLSVILNSADIKAVFCNGKTSHKLYQKYLEKITGISAKALPSTSPANASWTLEILTGKWKEELSPYL